MVKDMNKTTKELISEYLADQTKKFDLVHADAFTTVAISDALHISRTIASIPSLVRESLIRMPKLLSMIFQ